jgi:tetratricopeptide (TPR) repeat protein
MFCGVKCTLKIFDFGSIDSAMKAFTIFPGQAHGALIFFDLSRLASLFKLNEFWLPTLVKKYPSIAKIVIGTKKDIVASSNQEMDSSLGPAFVKENNLQGYLEISSKTGENVREATLQLLKAIFDQVKIPYDIKDIDKDVNKPIEITYNNILLALISKDAKTLSIRGNNIKDITQIMNLDKIPGLLELDLSENSIEAIQGLENLQQLESIILKENSIKKTDGLAGLINLKRLELSSNKIVDITGLENLPALEVLTLGNNKIAQIRGLENIFNLKELDLSFNKIKRISGLSHLKNLSILHLYNNILTSINGLTKLNSLEELYLDSNSITKIQGLEGAVNLKMFSIGNNPISEIAGMQSLARLQRLNLSGIKVHEELVDSLGGLDSDSYARDPQAFVKYCEETRKLRINADSNPRDLTAWKKLGDFHKAKGLPNVADRYYAKMMEIGKGSAELKGVDASTLNEMGDIQYEKKNFSEAIECYNKALKTNPDNAEILMKLGNIYFEKNMYDDSVKFYNKTLEFKPENPDAWLSLGNAYLAEKDYDHAKHAFKKALIFEPDNAITWNNLGNIYHIKENWDEAVDCYEKAVEFDTGLVLAWLNCGLAHKKRNDLDEAAQCFSKVLQLKPGDPTALNGMGNIFHERSKAQPQLLDDAITHYQKAVESNSSYAIAWNNLGAAQYSKKDFDAALKSLKHSLDLVPDNPDAWNNLGSAHDAKGNLAEAAKCYNKALSLKEDFLIAWENLGHTLKKTGDREGAERCFKKSQSYKKIDELELLRLGDEYISKGDLDAAIENYKNVVSSKPDIVSAWKKLAVVYTSKGNIEDAIGCYRKVIDIKPSDDIAWMDLGTVYSSKGLIPDAITCFKKSVEIKSDSYKAWRNLGVSYSSTGDFANAILAFRKALDLKQDDDISWNSLGEAMLRKGDFSEATRCFDKAVELDPRDSVKWKNLADANYKKGNSEEAIRCYRKALDIKQDDATTWVNLGSIYRSKMNLNEAIKSYKKAVEISPGNKEFIKNLGEMEEDLARERQRDDKEKFDKEIVIKLLEHEKVNRREMTRQEMIRILDLDIDVLQHYPPLIHNSIDYLDADTAILKVQAANVIKHVQDICLLEILKKIHVSVDLAKKIGQFLVDRKIISRFPRIPEGKAALFLEQVVPKSAPITRPAQLSEGAERDMVIKILEFEMKNGREAMPYDLVKELDADLDHTDYFVGILRSPVNYADAEITFFKQHVRPVLQKDSNPCLLDVLKLFSSTFNVLLARKFGKYLVDKEIINSFPLSHGISELSKIPDTSAAATPFQPYEGSEPFLYISHAQSDFAEVEQVLHKMVERKIPIWFDSGTLDNRERSTKIAQRISRCKAFMVFLSSKSVALQNIHTQIALAEQRYRKGEIRLIPVFIEDLKLPDTLEYTIGRIHTVIKTNFTQEQFVSKLMRAWEDAINPSKQEKKAPGENDMLEIVDEMDRQFVAWGSDTSDNGPKLQADVTANTGEQSRVSTHSWTPLPTHPPIASSPVSRPPTPMKPAGTYPPPLRALIPAKPSEASHEGLYGELVKLEQKKYKAQRSLRDLEAKYNKSIISATEFEDYKAKFTEALDRINEAIADIRRKLVDF